MRSSLYLVFAVALALVACGKDDAADSSKPSEATPAPTNPDARRVAIEVGKTGYSPNTLEAAANEELVLVFTRVADTECGRYVKLKGGSDKVELPMNEPVEFPVTMPASGELVFTCGMDMMHGIITVDSDRG